MSGFSLYLRDVAAGFASQKALADAIGITPQRLSRALAGDGNYSLNTDNCLRLARAANRPAAEVLRAAGKGDIADLLEHLLPKAGRPTMTGEQRELLDKWESIRPDIRENLKALINHAAGAAVEDKPAKRKSA